MRRGFRLFLACAALWAAARGTAEAAVVLQLRVVEGDGAIYAIGSRASRGITVQVTDETGKPVEDASVSFRLPGEGPTGIFAGGLKTEVVTTRADGRATVWGMQWNKNPGPMEIRITAVKDQARAGILASQYLSDKVTASPADAGTFRSSHHRRDKLLLILAGVAGAGAAGALLGARAGHAATATTPPPQVGVPTITIGHP